MCHCLSITLTFISVRTETLLLSFTRVLPLSSTIPTHKRVEGPLLGKYLELFPRSQGSETEEVERYKTEGCRDP